MNKWFDQEIKNAIEKLSNIFISQKWEDYKKWSKEEKEKDYKKFMEGRWVFGGFCPKCKHSFMSLDLPKFLVGICWDCRTSTVVEMGSFIDIPIEEYAKNIIVYNLCEDVEPLFYNAEKDIVE